MERIKMRYYNIKIVYHKNNNLIILIGGTIRILLRSDYLKI
jgi:hypothetical protein